MHRYLQYTHMTIVRDPDHSDGAPLIEGTGVRVKDVAVAYEHRGYDPDEIAQLYPDLSERLSQGARVLPRRCTGRSRIS